jgi:hypothetical protein
LKKRKVKKVFVIHIEAGLTKSQMSLSKKWIASFVILHPLD